MSKSVLSTVVLCLLLIVAASGRADSKPLLKPGQRVLFLGDSITYSGGYIRLVEAFLATRYPGQTYDVINLGLSSETACGLSEPYHPFPRPNVHQRLGRALEKIKPDLVVACYGMNDGIYHPFSEQRFAAYQRGINKLVSDCRAAGAKVILVTPPPFDPQPVRKKVRPREADEFGFKDVYENYDSEVLARYAEWIMQRGKQDDVVAAIDIHTPINQYLADQRKDDPSFTISGDGVHPNGDGHRMFAKALLQAMGYDNVDLSEQAIDPAVKKLVTKRHTLLRNAWLSEVGHKRPGIKEGKPIKEAQQQADELTKQIRQQVNQ